MTLKMLRPASQPFARVSARLDLELMLDTPRLEPTLRTLGLQCVRPNAVRYRARNCNAGFFAFDPKEDIRCRSSGRRRSSMKGK